MLSTLPTMLVVIGRGSKPDHDLCRCACGVEKEIRRSSLNSGATKSCGCRQRRLATARGRVHGKTGSRTYNIWCGMKQRCYSAEHESYPAYGGRGITVCERWRNSFAAFLEDMGECPSGHQLDRKDNDNPYCAENCRWVTPAANARNKSNSVTVTFAGRTLIVTDWAKELGVPRRTLDYRIKHWGVERAMVAAGAAHAEITG